MGRRTTIVGFAVLIASIAALGLFGYRALQETRVDIKALRGEIADATKIAREESAAAAWAGKRAEEAATRADVAAHGRQQAEVNRDQAVVAAQQSDQQARQAHDQMTQMQREREEELNRMQEALNKIVETRRTSNGMVMVLPNSSFKFEFDSSDLSAQNRELLARIAGILLISKGYGLSVFGYTDDVGTAEYNQQLSIRRAKAVQDYLVHAGLSPSIINVKGYGKSSPLLTGTSADKRAKNRRVEIALTDSSIRYDGASAPQR